MTPLPFHKYIPGQTARHPENAFEAIRTRALARTETETAHKNPPWLYGLRLIEAGFYWEAHEVWEPVWLNARPNSAERLMCQAVIQLANAALKQDMGKTNAAGRLCDIASTLLEDVTHSGDPSPMGLDPRAVRSAIEQTRQGQSDKRLSISPPKFTL